MKEEIEEIIERFDKSFCQSSDARVGLFGVKDFIRREFETYFQKRLREILPEKEEVENEGLLMEIKFGETTIGDIDKMCSRNRQIGYNQCIQCIENILNNNK